jgi:hypothetical protein
MQPLLQCKIIKYYIYWLCVYSISYLVWNAHGLYYTYFCLWSVWMYHIFPHYLTNCTIFGGKKVIDYKMCVFISSTTPVWNISVTRNPCLPYLPYSVRIHYIDYLPSKGLLPPRDNSIAVSSSNKNKTLKKKNVYAHHRVINATMPSGASTSRTSIEIRGPVQHPVTLVLGANNQSQRPFRIQITDF